MAAMSERGETITDLRYAASLLRHYAGGDVVAVQEIVKAAKDEGRGEGLVLGIFALAAGLLPQLLDTDERDAALGRLAHDPSNQGKFAYAMLVGDKTSAQEVMARVDNVGQLVSDALARVYPVVPQLQSRQAMAILEGVIARCVAHES